MNWRSLTQTKTTSSFTPVPTGLLQRKCASCGQHTMAGGGCSQCQKQQTALQRSATDQSESSEVPTIVNEVLRSTGQPLETETRAFMESRFNQDFSQVRIHTDGKAAESARAVNATAYTVKQDIAFDTGKYTPQNQAGNQLLAHELAHVVQQSQGSALAASDVSDSSLERSADRAASDLIHSSNPIKVAGATAPGLARQKPPEATKSQPSIKVTITQQSGRTIVAINDVAIAEGNAVPGAIEFAPNWTPENLDVVITIPEGQEMIQIEGSSTNAALLKLSSRFTLTIRRKLKVPQRTFNELEGGFDPLKEFETIKSITGQRPKPLPPKKASVPLPQTPPKVTAPQGSVTPEPSTTTMPESNVQVVAPPPTNLNLPPSAKYGKPRTDEEIVKERVNKIIKDAMAGRSDIPPLPKNIDQKTLLNVIKQGVSEAVKPLIKGLPPNVQSFILDKIDSAVEEGVSAIVDAAVDSAKVDPTTKAAIKKAVEAGVKLKEPQPPPAKK